MRWNGRPGAGFTREGVRPWLPIGDPGAINVEDERGDPDSVLQLCRDLIVLRRRTPDLRSGAYASLPTPQGAWAWRRGEGTRVAVNLSGEPASLHLGPATIEIGTDRARDGEAVGGDLGLRPWEGAVLRQSV